MGVIIIAVFWLLGLLMAWSMCVVAERADRRMEEIRHTHTDTDISRPADTGHAGRGRRPVRAMDGCHDDNAGDGRNNERTLPAENHRGGAASSASSSSHSRGGARAEAGSINRKGGVTC